MSLRFRVVEGAHVHEFEFDRDRVTIGRGPTNDVVLENAAISRKHGVFERRSDGALTWSTDQLTALTRSGAHIARTDGGKVSTWELHRGDVLQLGDDPELAIEVLSTRTEPPPTPIFTALRPPAAGLLDEVLLAAAHLDDDDMPAALLRSMQRALAARGVESTTTLVAMCAPDEFRNDAWRWADGECVEVADPTAALGDAMQSIRSAWNDGPSIASFGDVALTSVGEPPEAMLVVQSDALNEDAVATLAEVAPAFRPLARLVVARLRAGRKHCALVEENRFFRERQRHHYLVKELVRESDAMRAVHERLHALGDETRPVLFAGEAGTGKELFARRLHHESDRAHQMLLRVNCAEITDESANLELFGTADGVTGPSKGVLELAQAGTVLLEEIDLLPPMVQAKLCRTLKENEVRRLGDSIARPVRARVIATVHRDVSEAITEGRLRRDLYLLFRDQTVIVPSLRDRRKDIIPLATKFLQSYATRYARDVHGFTEEAESRMLRHFWPGNVRELQSRVEAAVLGTTEALVDVGHLGLG